MIKESTHYVYLLKCPLTNVVKYVGVSMNPKVRYRAHLNGFDNKAKCEWIQSLKSEGLLPVMEIVESCDKRVEVGAIENKYIKLYRETIFNSNRKNNFSPEYHFNYVHKNK
ncbi:GIY-YIG nuclease family protein [Elizabethkingia anophelis]|uniref:GIY-YIG nuclease family protein n=1 Tax=Elizabethkingia anophelis TaxID=1117645 RepID=UPI003786FCEF